MAMEIAIVRGIESEKPEGIRYPLQEFLPHSHLDTLRRKDHVSKRWPVFVLPYYDAINY